MPTLSSINGRPDTQVPVLDEDPFSDAILSDPLPFQHRLRQMGPVVWLPRYAIYASGQYPVVHEGLKSWQQLRSGAGVGLADFTKEEPWRPPSLLLEADPPAHDAPRHVLSQILSPRALRGLADRWAQDARDLVDTLLPTGSGSVQLDLTKDLAERYPLRVFPDAVGLPDEGRENLLPYGDHAFNAFGPRNHLVEKRMTTIGEISAWVNSVCDRSELADDSFGSAIWEAADRGDITYAQAPLIVRSLLTAGVDTTVHAISAILYAFATHPSQWRALREDPGLIRTAFDEAVRWESPVQSFFRTTTEELRFESRTGETSRVPEGSKVVLFLGAANRDPERWKTPDEFSLDRDPSGHVGFGMGIHQCVGQHVARLEAESLLKALLERVDSIQVTEQPRRHLNNTLRAFDSIPVQMEVSK